MRSLFLGALLVRGPPAAAGAAPASAHIPKPSNGLGWDHMREVVARRRGGSLGRRAGQAVPYHATQVHSCLLRPIQNACGRQGRLPSYPSPPCLGADALLKWSPLPCRPLNNVPLGPQNIETHQHQRIGSREPGYPQGVLAQSCRRCAEDMARAGPEQGARESASSQRLRPSQRRSPRSPGSLRLIRSSEVPGRRRECERGRVP